MVAAAAPDVWATSASSVGAAVSAAAVRVTGGCCCVLEVGCSLVTTVSFRAAAVVASMVTSRGTSDASVAVVISRGNVAVAAAVDILLGTASGSVGGGPVKTV